MGEHFMKEGRSAMGGLFVVFGPCWRHTINSINAYSYVAIEAQNSHFRPIAAHIEKRWKLFEESYVDYSMANGLHFKKTTGHWPPMYITRG